MRSRGSKAMAKTLKKKTFQSAALQYTYDRYIGNDAKRIQEYEEEVLNAEIARKVYDLPRDFSVQNLFLVFLNALGIVPDVAVIGVLKGGRLKRFLLECLGQRF